MLFILLVFSSHHQLDSFRYRVHVLFLLAILLMFLLCQIVATFLRLCGLTWPRYSQIGCYGVSATLFICTTNTHTHTHIATNIQVIRQPKGSLATYKNKPFRRHVPIYVCAFVCVFYHFHILYICTLRTPFSGVSQIVNRNHIWKLFSVIVE